MQAFLWLIGVILFAVGGYNIACDLCDVPTKKTVRAMQAAIRQNGTKKEGYVDAFVSKLARRFSHLIIMDDIKRAELENSLRIAKKNMTPEAFILYIVLIAVVISAAFFPVSVLLNNFIYSILGSVLGIALAAMQYRKILGSVEDRRARIVTECPRFASYLAQNFANANRDILGLFQSYQHTANMPEFAEELNTTIADMKLGNYEAALMHMQQRVNHSAMTEIIRGLNGVLRGDDQTAYFERVCMNMKALEEAMLKLEAKKRPKKIMFYQFAIMVGTILMMAVALVTQLIDSLQLLF